MNTTTDQLWFTLTELEERWHVSRSNLIRRIKANELKAMQFGVQWRVSAEEVAIKERPGLRKPRSVVKPEKAYATKRKVSLAGDYQNQD